MSCRSGALAVAVCLALVGCPSDPPERPETPTPALSGRELPTVSDPGAVTHWIIASSAGLVVSALTVFQAPEQVYDRLA